MSAEGLWLYRVTGPRKRRYIAKLKDIEPSTVMEMVEKHNHDHDTLFLDYDGLTVRDSRNYDRKFGVTLGCNNYLDICGRCNVIGQFVRTALCCPECDELIGGV